MTQMDADSFGTKEHKERKKLLPLRLEQGESDATLAHRMGEGLGVRVLGEVLFRAPRSAIRI